MAHLVTKNGKTFIRDEWGTEDIQSVAECNFEILLTKEQVAEVMEKVVESYDANIGISWDTISAAIKEAV
jgi:uncharacterized protein YlzI (FlbEa/FlbD family)